jgi:leucyl aminopeptidase (aminopeptidase T)
VLKKPVTVTVKEGFATSITGGREASIFDSLLSAVKKREAYNIAELGVGCNPKGRLIGIILEDEKVYGTVHVALGDNSTFGGKVQAGIHLDGIMLKPTMFIDGQIVIKDGAWVI